MPVLQALSGKLTYFEYQKRLEENPDDLELKEAKQKFQEAVKVSSLGIQTQFLDIHPFLNFSRQVSDTIKQFTLPTTILADTIRTFNSSACFFPKLFPVINAAVLTPNLSLALNMLNQSSINTVKQTQDSQAGFLSEIQERMKESLKPPEITYIPESSNVRVARLEARIVELIDVISQKDDTVTNQPIQSGLADIYPSGNKKFKIDKKILTLLVSNKRVEFYLMAKCIESGLTRSKYKHSKSYYVRLIENCIVVIRRRIKKFSYTISTLNSQYAELKKLNS